MPRRPARPKISFYFGLERPEAQARAAFTAVSQPGSPSYRKFVGVRDVARRYGASARTIRTLKRRARRHGLVARIDRSGRVRPAHGPVPDLRADVPRRGSCPRSTTTCRRAPGSSPGNRPLRVPRDLRPLVREVVGVYARSARIRRGGRGRACGPGAGPAAGQRRHLDGRLRQGARHRELQLRPGQERLRRRRGRQRCGSVGGPDERRRGRAGERCQARRRLLRAAEDAPARRCSRTARRARSASARRSPSSTSRWSAAWHPASARCCSRRSGSTPDLWFLGPSQTLAASSLPDSLSISYGICERDLRGRRAGPGGALERRPVRRSARAPRPRRSRRVRRCRRLRLDLQRRRLRGRCVPGLVALPDRGGRHPARARRRANARVDEVVWNDLPWIKRQDGGGAGGGGLSQFSSRPPWQAGLPVAGARRAAPDVSAHASLLPGWPVALGDNWLGVGGTSAATPLIGERSGGGERA